MKNTTLILLSLFLTGSLFAQDNDEQKAEKRMETIRIIDGDTVMHEIRTVSRDNMEERKLEKRYIQHERMMDEDVLSEEIDEILKEMDIYINLDEKRKEMIIRKVISEDVEMEEIIKEMSGDEDLVIDMKNGKKEVKIIKIIIDEDSGEEVKVIELEESRKGRGHDEMHREVRRERAHKKEEGMKMFPNPAKEELNLEFEVRDGKPAEVVVMDMDGEKVFSKTYKEGGSYKESISLKGKKKGMYVVRLIDVNRTISKTIIVE